MGVCDNAMVEPAKRNVAQSCRYARSCRDFCCRQRSMFTHGAQVGNEEK